MADVSDLLGLGAPKKSISVVRDVPIELDVALLAAFDPNPINGSDYNTDREEALKDSARGAIQTLVNALFSLPTVSVNEAVLATLPPAGPSTVLPRAKPLPKAAPLTKWQKFAKEKGIVPKPKTDKLVFDQDKQEWVNRWGWKGRNKDEETAWIREVKPGEDANGGLERNKGKQARKERSLKNEKQRLQNARRAAAESAKSSTTAILEAADRPSTTIDSKSAVRAAKIARNTEKTRAAGLAKRQEQAKRKREVEDLLETTKKSTASMGKFDKSFANEPKIKGLKRKFAPTELPAKAEHDSHMAIATQLQKDPLAFKEKVAKRSKKLASSAPEQDKTKGLVNARKAIRAVSGGRGASSMDGIQTKPLKKSKKRN